MKSEKAKKLLDVSSLMDDYGYRYVHFDCAVKAVKLAEQEMSDKAIEAFKEHMKQMHGGYLSSDGDDFLKKLDR